MILKTKITKKYFLLLFIFLSNALICFCFVYFLFSSLILRKVLFTLYDQKYIDIHEVRK